MDTAKHPFRPRFPVFIRSESHHRATPSSATLKLKNYEPAEAGSFGFSDRVYLASLAAGAAAGAGAAVGAGAGVLSGSNCLALLPKRVSLYSVVRV